MAELARKVPPWAAIVPVDRHRPRRDLITDAEARSAPISVPLDIGDDTYQGVWRRTEHPEDPPVHVFTLPGNLPALPVFGFERVNGCEAVDRCVFDRTCPAWARECSTIRPADG